MFLNKFDNDYLVELFECLNDIRDSGLCNMYGAAPYLQEDFPELTEKEAIKILCLWMDNFDPNKTPKEIVEGLKY